jgi:hypothetical protein
MAIFGRNTPRLVPALTNASGAIREVGGQLPRAVYLAQMRQHDVINYD